MIECVSKLSQLWINYFEAGDHESQGRWATVGKQLEDREDPGGTLGRNETDGLRAKARRQQEAKE